MQFKTESLSGIYLHIPFCRQACHYCDFHFSTNLKNVDQLVDAIGREISERKGYLHGEKIETVYFGGGTPSILNQRQLGLLLSGIHEHFQVANDAEITLEVNPEDVNLAAINMWKSLGVNRVSLGIQTFNEEKLKYINRCHSSDQAMEAMDLIASNFDNFNADLIYAIPPASDQSWLQDVEDLLSYDPPHVSVYGLTIEQETVFGKWASQGKLKEVSESDNAQEYKLAIEQLESSGYIHYEISNFCRPDYFSRHNTSYWKGAKYLGVGPGAHSYDGDSRSWNIRNNPKYIRSLEEGKFEPTREELSPANRQNEYVMTRLRNIWGIDLVAFQKMFNADFLKINKPFTDQLFTKKLAIIKEDHFHLTKAGWFLADEISERLMIDA
ncbi:MAG: radical SAM family heme chaperone HemW [Cyclobacteriaceae bacterium]